MDAMAVAEAGYRALMGGRRRVVPGWRNQLLVALARLTPNALLLPMLERIQSARRR